LQKSRYQQTIQTVILNKLPKNINPQILLSLLWIILTLIVNPNGNFPLNDDWAYAKNVYYLAEQGILKFSDWPAMTLISHMLWGAAFCKIFGFSFTVLRISVLIIGLIGTNLIFVLTKQLTNNIKTALLATMVLCYNPLYFSLSFTFMTDVPFLIFVLGALYFYSEFNIYPEKTRHIVVATLFSAIATLSRQTGLILPVAAVLVTFMLERKINKKFLFHFISATVVAGLLFAYIHWLKVSGNMSSNFSNVGDLFKTITAAEIIEKIWSRSCIILKLNGLFLLPFLIYIFNSYWQNVSERQRKILLLSSVILSLTLLFSWKQDLASNILNNYGLGPRVLKDYYWGMNVHPQMPQFELSIIKIAAIVGSFLLIFYFLTGVTNILRKRNGNHSFDKQIIGNRKFYALRLISLGIIAFYWLFLVLGTYFFDRYMLFLLPFLIILFIPAKYTGSKITGYISLTLTGFYLFFSLASTHDYLSWNRARWKALNTLTNSGISPQIIDGGFEFNGWYQTNKRNEDELSGKSWWFVKDDIYLIAFGDFCGYQKIKRYDFTNYLTFDTDSIFVLKRMDNPQSDTISILCDAEKTKYVNEELLMQTSDSTLYCVAKNTRTSSEAHSGNYCVELNKSNLFAYTIDLKGIGPCETIVVSAYTKYNLKNAFLVVSSADGQDLYMAQTVSDTLKSNTWKYMELRVRQFKNLPQELKFYVWNNSEQRVLIDDFKIERILY